MTEDLFPERAGSPACIALGPRACLLCGFADARATALLGALDEVTALAPFRHMITPGGFTMSVAMTNCGRLGWTSDRHGYRYTETDPQTGCAWPGMPEIFREVAHEAASAAGFPDFMPDACLINRYVPGARLTLHQDKNERDLSAPIVSVSLGIRAVFLFGGDKRSDKAVRVPLCHGDVAVWGGVDRMRYHGVLAIKEERHPLLGAQRINLTFRKAG